MTRMTATETKLMDLASQIATRSELSMLINKDSPMFGEYPSPEKRVFQAAYALVKNRNTWCQGSMEQTVEQMYLRAVPVHTGLPNTDFEMLYDTRLTKRFCSIGAVREAAKQFQSDSFRLYGRVIGEQVLKALKKTLHHMGIEASIAAFNDSRSHADVCWLWEHTGRREGWL